MSNLATPPRPLCFVAMPFGVKTAPSGGQTIDFKAVYAAMEVGIAQSGLDCRRADFDPAGGFIHRSMFESLLLAEYVVVDLTFANANVAYEVGLRHGANAGHGTILICEDESLKSLPFDFKPLRILPYKLADLTGLQQALTARLKEALAGALPQDNPILQITNIQVSSSGHEKTDLFAQRMAYVSKVGAEVSEILAGADRDQAVHDLQTLEAQVLDPARNVEQLHTALLSIYLGYRAKEAWPEMVALFAHMPGELQASPVTREQLALAHNRIAEGMQDSAASQQERQRALQALEMIPKSQWTSETFGILGRIHKGRADAELQAGRERESQAALTAAIKAYESGFAADPRDYFPGVNAVTLRILRNRPEDPTALEILLPAVRFSVGRAPAPTRDDEVYWQAATKLELAAVARDWNAAQVALDDVLGVKVDGWMRKTTADNLERQRRARENELTTQSVLKGIIEALRAV